jgi:LEA14-like dessication related protein
MRSLNVLFAVLFSMFFVGCTPMLSPKVGVGLTDLRLSDMSLFETSLNMQLRVENRSSDLLNIDGVTHDIRLNDIHIGTALDGGRFVVPPLSSVTRTVPVSVGNLSLFSRLKDLIESGKFAYEIESTIYTKELGTVLARRTDELDLGVGTRAERRKNQDPDEFKLMEELPPLPPPI